MLTYFRQRYPTRIEIDAQGKTIEVPLPDPIKPGWLLLYDYCMTNRFGASYSPDLLNWKVEEDVSFPSEARHGCVSLLTPEEAKTLIKTYSGKNGGK